MMWVIVLVLVLLGGFTGFLVGFSYGQEHRNE